MDNGIKAQKVSKHLALTTTFQEVHAIDHRRAITIHLIHICNVTAGAVTVNLCYVPIGDVAGIANAVLWEKSIPANDFITILQTDIARGVSIQAKASADNSITIKLSGEEEASI